MVRQATGDSSTSTSVISLDAPNESSRHEQLMRQQFYTNNERSRATTRNIEHHRLHSPSASSSKATTSQRPTQRPMARASSPHKQFNHSTATANQSYILNDSSSHLQQQHHMNRALDEKLTRVAISSLYNTTTPNPLDNGWDSSMVMPNNCANGGTSLNGNNDCGESKYTSQMMKHVNFTGELDFSGELNFSEIEDVWLVKDWQEILVRVSCVAPIVLLGLIGNLTIIYSMYRFKQIRSKPTNIFILNMALADLLTTIVCPNAALLTDIFQFYVLGSFVCRFEGFIKITCLLVSAYSLIVLSFDWFLCVVKPCRRRITIRQSWLTLISIWIVSILMAMPLIYWRSLRERRWKDLVEVWCCELIQYTKYYWVGITLFLIYLPTVVMTIVLVVILAQMDRFEAKLKRTRKATAIAMRNSNSSSSSNHHRIDNIKETTTTTNTNSVVHIHSMSFGGTSSSQLTGSIEARDHLSNSLSITMRYRRRIVKILFFYLLTSIVCWTPLQFVIIYRHFRTEAVPAAWFFELTFYSQLCASLSSAMNPIIFGFLSLPFRRVVTKSWMFRFFDKVLGPNTNKNNPRSENGKAAAAAAVAAVNGDNNVLDQKRRPGGGGHNGNHLKVLARNNMHYGGGRRQSPRTTRVDDNFEQPKLTIEYIEHENQHVSGNRESSATRTGNNNAGAHISTGRDNRAFENENEEDLEYAGNEYDDDDDDDDAIRRDLSQEHMQIKMKHLNTSNSGNNNNHNNNNNSIMRDHFNNKRQQLYQ